MGDALTSPGTNAQPRRPFFGRAADLDLLLTRARTPGMTVLIGRPRCGKTRLFLEAREQLLAEGVIVGYAEASPYRPDLAARALANAYATAMAAGQRRRVLEQADPDLAARLAQVSGTARKAVLPAPLLGVPGRPWRTPPRPAERGLDHVLLTAADLRGLVSFLALTGDRPVVLFLDGWTAAPEEAADAAVRGLLERPAEAPGCRVFVAVDATDPVRTAAKARFAGPAGGPQADVHELGRLDLHDPAETHRLTRYLIGTVPAMCAVDQRDALDLLDGCPAVLQRWLALKPGTPEELERVADDAHHDRYPELRALLLAHCRSAPREAGLLAALALLPRLTDRPTWLVLAGTLTEGLDPDVLARLRAAGVLEATASAPGVPSYGSDGRWRAARELWLSGDEHTLRALARDEAGRLAPLLAGLVVDGDPDAAVVATALAALLELREGLALKGAALRLCTGAAALFPSRAGSPAPAALRGWGQPTLRDHRGAGALVGMALRTATARATVAGDRATRDLLLAELRGLSDRHPDELTLRHQLAQTLADGVRQSAASSDRTTHDTLLAELRGLCRRHPHEPAVVDQLALALAASVQQACLHEDHRRRDEHLGSLRRLCAEHPADAVVRAQLATALLDGMDEACAEADETCRDTLLEELRKLNLEHPGDQAVRLRLATGLVDAVGQACRERHPAQRSAWLEALRSLYATHPSDAAVREKLGEALADSLSEALWEGDQAHRDALLKELRQLDAVPPGDAILHERLTTALLDSLSGASWSGDSARCDALLGELRALCAAHPTDEKLRERLETLPGAERSSIGDAD
jgi:hypothetical protein